MYKTTLYYYDSTSLVVINVLDLLDSVWHRLDHYIVHH